MKFSKLSILVTLSSLFFLIPSLMFLDGHQYWGGDFAHYLINARNILLGRPYQYMLDGLPIANPGFPLYLAGVQTLFGSSFVTFQVFNVFLWLAFSFLSFRYFRLLGASKRFSLLGFCLILFNFKAYFLKHQVLVDIPVSLIYVICLLYFSKLESRQMDRMGVSIGRIKLFFDSKGFTFSQVVISCLLLLLGTLFKPGFISMVAAAIAFFVLSKNLLAPVLILASQVGLYIYENSILGANSFSSHVSAGLRMGKVQKSQNMDALLNFVDETFFQIFKFFSNQIDFISGGLSEGFSRPLQIVLAVVLVILIFFGMYSDFKKRKYIFTFKELFYFSHLGMLSLWHTPLDHRFLFPVYPLTLYYLYSAFLALSSFSPLKRYPYLSHQRVGAAVTVFCLALNVRGTDWRYSKHDSTNPYIMEVYSWIKNDSDPNLKVAFFKMRTMAYFVDRETIGIREKYQLEKFFSPDVEPVLFVIHRRKPLSKIATEELRGQILFENEGYQVILTRRKASE